MTTAAEFANGLWETLMERRAFERGGKCVAPGTAASTNGVVFIDGDGSIHEIANACPICSSPVTNAQIEDGEAHMRDERGPHDGEYEHDECARGVRYE